MENLPDTITQAKTPIQIDLILGGGAFNGGYILGALYFLKELERKNLVVVRRISTCSISSILGLLYLTDNLDKANELYLDILQDFKDKGNLSKLFECKQLFSPYVSDEDCPALGKRLYISYHNIRSCKKRVKYRFVNTDELFETITRSCFVPFMIDYTPAYKDTYIDGILPHWFPSSRWRTRLYVNVYTTDKLAYTINVKNEKNNYHRLFEGMLDIHEYFIKKTNTTMCSNVDCWGLYQYGLYYMYTVLEKVVVYLIYLILLTKTHLSLKSYKLAIEYSIKTLLRVFCF
ncbi:MAG: hypothetical protein ACOVRN_01815 [Flavobacterium sp.]